MLTVARPRKQQKKTKKKERKRNPPVFVQLRTGIQQRSKTGLGQQRRNPCEEGERGKVPTLGNELQW